ncbi:MAG: Asp-tRNA(Asn)/Glu-tRNA(Gln) amidotransferase subunit GatB [Defluviitaleaceae bacterium]|nr:Asp-tRNA(Asn)/Glu-tRNA(Gln) amidotransferase subunit GatB [Defluviitaleaceae bacterium]MCL2262403.1 Asp-tRNA(Asn)/Glu-tRNA(Gln) amidotransferase subunit GatB [Defluviitaleaceae bacterium]
MNWDIVIGLEIHVELSTASKIFCGCSTAFGGEPNTQCCPVCIGMPGTLPVLNTRVLDFAVKAGLALNCQITRYNKFDRKNYFYPDLPKAYQISQLHLPFARNGFVDIGDKKIRIHEIHMEEDAGKLIHSSGKTFLDYNRCGVPLIEIVTEPDMTCAEEVIACLTSVKSMLEYLEVSDCQMQEGSLRADVNLSVKPKGSTEFGTRTEMKNINSFKAIERAIAYESRRQIEVISSGGEISQETRRWDDNAGESFVMRSKENAPDYRYFPDPDIPPISFTDEFIASIQENQPEFAKEKAARFAAEYGLTPKDAAILTTDKNTAQLYEETAKSASPKETAVWMLGEMMYLASTTGAKPKITPPPFAEFINAVTGGKTNRTAGKQVFEYVFGGGEDVAGYIEKHGLAQINDDASIAAIVEKVLAANADAVAEYKSGKEKAFGFLVGQTMKELKGKGNPALVNAALKKHFTES